MMSMLWHDTVWHVRRGFVGVLLSFQENDDECSLLDSAEIRCALS